MTTELFSPASYKTLSDKDKSRICNGCGAKGSISGLFTPSTLYGLSIHESCLIHDYQYFLGTNASHKESADRSFLYNMQRQIEQGSKWLIWLRKRRALKYYYAVKYFGGTAFWDKD